MKHVIRVWMIVIGVIATAAVVLSIPILFVCSIYENWPWFVKLPLFCLNAGETLAVVNGIIDILPDYKEENE